MRSDYVLYTAAIISFIITGIVLVYQIEQPYKGLWVVTTAVLGLLFVGLGYSQRAKPQVKAVEPTPAPTPQPAPAVTEVVVEEKPVTTTEITPPILELTQVKGIKEKRAGQLKAVGINSVEDLAKASAEDLAAKLKISPKIIERWIEEAKKLSGKS